MSTDKKKHKESYNYQKKRPGNKSRTSILTFVIVTIVILIENLINSLIFAKATQFSSSRIIQLAFALAAISVTISLLFNLSIRFISRRPAWLKLLVIGGLFILLVIVIDYHLINMKLD